VAALTRIAAFEATDATQATSGEDTQCRDYAQVVQSLEEREKALLMGHKSGRLKLMGRHDWNTGR
jgi:hypothetical protein